MVDRLPDCGLPNPNFTISTKPIKLTSEQQKAAGVAERFLNGWVVSDPEQPISEQLGQSYLSPHAQRYLEHVYQTNSISREEIGRILGIQPEKGLYGAFDIADDVPDIEAGLIRPNLAYLMSADEAQRQFITGWQNDYENIFNIEAPGRPQPQKSFRARLVNWVAQAYDANATIGHIVNIAAGGVAMNRFLDAIGQSDIITRVGPAGGLLALALIGSFNLPNRGMDQSSEKWPHRVLTFAPTIAMGMLTGMMAKTPEQALAITPLAVVLAASGMSYWRISQMSREFMFTKFNQAGVFSRQKNLADLIMQVKASGAHDKADDLLKKCGDPRNYWRIVKIIRNDLAPTVGAQEPLIRASIADIRDYFHLGPDMQ